MMMPPFLSQHHPSHVLDRSQPSMQQGSSSNSNSTSFTMEDPNTNNATTLQSKEAILNFYRKIDSWISVCHDTGSSSSAVIGNDDDAAGLASHNPEEIRSGIQESFRTMLTMTEGDNGGHHEDALARLIQKLEGAFGGDDLAYCHKALFAVVGAIRGCHDMEKRLSHSTMQLFGTFFLGHCKPIDDHEYDEDYDSMIRDIAVEGLSVLLQCYPTEAQQDHESFESAITLRITLGMTGVKNRCSIPATPDEADGLYYGGASSSPVIDDVRGGLSLLPRSKRSLCFDLLRYTLIGVGRVSFPTTGAGGSPSDTLRGELGNMARFTSNCLDGESDPRCLQQLLQLIFLLLTTMVPFFATATTTNEMFPIADTFDAVAPYYPIQFTPPPNNVHGITREGLHEALLSVLTFTSLDGSARESNANTMINLSSALFLEQLLPIDGEDDPSAIEKMEALHCLQRLLFPASGDCNCCQFLDASVVESFFEALKRTHDLSSLVASHGGEIGDRNRLLADTCRSIVSKVAYQLELAPKQQLWQKFVAEPLQKQAPLLAAVPAQHKTTIAFIACLAASGGPRTLRCCLSSGLEPLIEFLHKKLNDTPDCVAAIHGMGAFFSSCRVATGNAAKEGVVFNPHPLDPYVERSSTVLLNIFEKRGDEFSMSSIVGVLRALECLLAASKNTQFDAPIVERLLQFFEVVLQTTTEVTSNTDATDFEDVCYDSFGSELGVSLRDIEEEKNSRETLLEEPKLQIFFKDVALPKLLASAIQHNNDLKNRGDWRTLSTACRISPFVARNAISTLINNAKDKMKSNGIVDPSTQFGAQAIDFLLRNGGDHVIVAFHEVVSIDSTLEMVLDSAGLHNDHTMRSSIANLSLPAPLEERESKKLVQQSTKRFVSHMSAGYSSRVPADKLLHLVNSVSGLLPPLSDADVFSLSVRLPLLCSALSSDTMSTLVQDPEVRGSVEPLLQRCVVGLLDFSLNRDADATSRSSACACVHGAIQRILRGKQCPVASLVSTKLNPALVGAASATAEGEYLRILALLGSAAVCRGKSSTATAVNIAAFFLDIAVSGEATHVLSDTNTIFRCNQKDDSTEGFTPDAAASAFGSILASSSVKPLIKQRLIHSSLGRIYDSIDASEASSGETCVSLYSLVGQIVCTTDLRSLESKTMKHIASLIVNALSSELFLVEKGAENVLQHTAARKRLVVTAALKIITFAPKSLDSLLLQLVTGLLRAYAASDPQTEVATKLLSLQALEQVSVMDPSPAIAKITPAVVAVLAAATTHPSGLLRQAAVDVRNAWYVLPQVK